MARANLSINDDIVSAFLSANGDDSDTRFVVVGIKGEELVLCSVRPRLSTAAEDFNTSLGHALKDDEAALVLFCLTDELAVAKRWLLIAWIPDHCKIRDKMLYSSSREDLKHGLGLGHFEADYAANCKADLTWDLYKASTATDNDNALSEKEIAITQEKVFLI